MVALILAGIIIFEVGFLAGSKWRGRASSAF